MRRRTVGNAHGEQNTATSAPIRRRTAASTKQRQKSHHHQQQMQAGSVCLATQPDDFESTQINQDNEPPRPVVNDGNVNQDDQQVAASEKIVLPLVRSPHKNGPLEENRRSKLVRQRQRTLKPVFAKTEDDIDRDKVNHDAPQQRLSQLDSVQQDESKQPTDDSLVGTTKTPSATMLSSQSIVTHIPSILMCESIVLTQPSMPPVKIYMSRAMGNDTPCLTFATAAPLSSSSSPPTQPSEWTVFDVRPVPSPAMIEAWTSGQQQTKRS